jgi:hypothetical protein
MAIGTQSSSEQRLPELCQRVLQMDANLDDAPNDEEIYGLGREHLRVCLLGYLSARERLQSSWAHASM